MAKINKINLLTYGLSGKLGNLIFVSRKGKPHTRALPKKRSSPASEAELAHRSRFALAFKCIKPAKQLIAFSFNDPGLKMTACNKAVSYALKTAVCGSYPAFYIDFSKLLLSWGNLPQVWDARSVAVGQETILFSWNDLQSDPDHSERGRDKAILIAYCEDPATCVYTTGDALRRDGQGLLAVKGMAGKTVHTYLGFTSDDEKKIADSVYTGEILVGLV